MSWWEILIIIAAAGFVAGYIAYSVIRRKRGKGGCCGCDCSGCTGCCGAHRKHGKDAADGSANT